MTGGSNLQMNLTLCTYSSTESIKFQDNPAKPSTIFHRFKLILQQEK